MSLPDSLDQATLTLRREFFLRLIRWATGILILFRARWSRAATQPLLLPLSRIPDLARVGGGAIIKLKGKFILLIRKDENTIRALNPACRHQQCQVLYQPDWKEIRCKCHGSKYDLDGKVINPPAKLDLERYAAVIAGDNLSLVLDETL